MAIFAGMLSQISGKKVLVCGLNPSWQKTIRLNKLLVGGVNRAAAIGEFASGKGINCAKVLQLLGMEPHVLQVCGGSTGEFLQKELDGLKISHQTLKIAQCSRVCTTICDLQGVFTEIIEPSPVIDFEEALSLQDLLEKSVQEHSLIALCGTLPQGFAPEKIAHLPRKGKRFFVDAWQHVQGILEKGVELLKINFEELQRICPESSLRKSAACALNSWPISTLVVTQGEKPVQAFTKNAVWTLPVPAITSVCNPIGAGDSFLAAWIHRAAGDNSLDMPSMLCHATAVASARCMVQTPAELDLQLAEKWEKNLYSQLQREDW